MRRAVNNFVSGGKVPRLAMNFCGVARIEEDSSLRSDDGRKIGTSHSDRLF